MQQGPLLGDAGEIKLHLRLILIQCCFVGVDGLARNDSLVDQLLVIGVDHGLIGGGDPILRQLGHRRVQRSRVLIDNDLKRQRIDERTDLARRDQRIIVTGPGFDVSGDKGFDLCGHHWIECAGHVDGALDIALSDTRCDVVQRRIATTPPPHGGHGKHDEQRQRGPQQKPLSAPRFGAIG